MKISRDSATVTNVKKIEHVDAIVRLIPDITHITVDCYMDNFGWQSVAYIKEWFDAIHNAGKKVIFRPAIVIDTVNSLPADLIPHFVSAAQDLATCWATTGDLWDVLPESAPTAPGFGGGAGWNQFVRDTITALNTEFASQGKTVDCTLWALANTSFIAAGGIEASTLTAMNNKICIDWYPMDWVGAPGKGSTTARVNNLIKQLANLRTANPTADFYLMETGYNNTNSVTDEDQREVLRTLFNALADVPYVKGFNYYCGYGEWGIILFQSFSHLLPRPALAMLSEYYTKGQCSGRMAVI